MEFLKTIRNVGLAAIAIPLAPAIGGAVILNSAAQLAIQGVRNQREKYDEENGDCYFVYYPLRDFRYAAADFVLPEIVGVDLVAGALNLKTQHCVAWFTTSPSTYVTIEITSGETQNVKKWRRIYGKNLY